MMIFRKTENHARKLLVLNNALVALFKYLQI